MQTFPSAIGNRTFKFIGYVGELTILLGHTIYWAFVPPFKSKRIFSQAQRIGPGSFFIASLVAFFVGMIIALQMAYQMVRIGAELYIPNVVSVSMARELSPVLTALIVAGRIGAGIAAEIGSMTVTEQVEALKAFAVNPVKYLVVPRFLGLVLMMPVLTIFADIIGILGGYVICVYKLGISPALFWGNVTDAVDPPDIITGLIKTIVFAAIIAMVGCHQGLNVKGGAEGVGKATTVAVVISFILIIMTDCLFTTIFFFIFKL